MRWEVLDSPEAVAQAAYQRILGCATTAIQANGRFRLVLAGGGTPKRCYQLLADTQADWDNWHLYFGDERCLPVDHPERNSYMATEALISQVPIPPDQVHPIPAEQGAEVAAQAYHNLIATCLPFDMVLLGMGEDGHTASLFPGQTHPIDTWAVPVHNAPKPPQDRVSLSIDALNRCRQMLIIVTGASKRAAISRWQRGEKLPIASLDPQGEGIVLLDQKASVPELS